MSRTPDMPEVRQLLSRVSKACGVLPMYWWRPYSRCKLYTDPVERLLAADDTQWGDVLDIGCGNGLVGAIALLRSGTRSYRGIDISPHKLEMARRLLSRLGSPIPFTLHAGRLPEDGSLLAGPHDTALLIDVLHYWPTSQQQAILTQICAALRPGGRLLLREGMAEARGGRVIQALERLSMAVGINPNTRRLNFLSRAQMTQLLSSTGFSVESVTAAGGRNFLWVCRA